TAKFARLDLASSSIAGVTRRLAGEMNLPCGRVTPAMLELAKSNLANFAVVGLTEWFDESLALLERAFGWRPRPYSAHNVGENRPLQSEVGEDNLKAVEHCNRFDLELYRYASGLFERALRGTAAIGERALAAV